MNHTIIIAEAGVNHNGSLDLAKKLVDIAAMAGADYVKFQTFKTELIISESAEKAEYQIANTMNSVESQFEMVKKLELTESEFVEIYNYCIEKKIGFMSTAVDIPSLKFLSDLNLDYYKISSGEVTNYPVLRYMSLVNKPIIFSTGMSDINEIETAMNILTRNGKSVDDIILLHCNTEYPTPMQDVNLRAMKKLGEIFHTKVGYSDHTEGIEVAIAAVALGAKIIEKHFTIDKNMEGPDHKASLCPEELIQMVKSIRNIEKSLGSDFKSPSDSERKNINIARKSIFSFKHIEKGKIIEDEDLIALRPGYGISAIRWEEVVGKKATSDIKAFRMLTENDFI